MKGTLHGQPQPACVLHSHAAHALAQETPVDSGTAQQKRKRGRPRKNVLLSSEADEPARAHRRPTLPLNTHSLFASIALAVSSRPDSSAPLFIDWGIGIPGLTPLDRIYSPSRLIYSVHVPTLQSRGASTFSPAPVAQLRRHPNARNLRTVYHSMMEFADVSHSENTQRLQCFPDLSDTAAKLDATVNPVLCAFDEGQQKPAVQVVAENTPNHLVKFDPSDISSISIDKQPALADRTQPAVRQELNTLPEQIIIIPTLQDLSAHPTIRVLHHNQTESRHAVSSPSKLPTPTASPLKPKHATPDSALVGGPQLPASPSGRQKRAKSLAAKSAALTTALAALRAQREREQQHVAEHGAMSFSGSLHDIAGGLRRFVSEVNGASLPPAPAEMQPALVEHLQTLKGAGKFAVPPGQVASAIKKRRIEAIDTALGLMGAADAAGRKLEFDEKDGERSSGTEREVEDVVVKMEGVDGPEPRKRTVSGKRSRPMIAMPDGILLSERKKRTLSRNQPASSFTHDARSTKRKEAGMTGGAMDATALLSSAAELLSQTEAAEALAAATLSGNSLSTAELANLRSVTSSPVSDPFSDGGQSGLDLLALLAATGAL